jgi:outer membrane receptor protein involved in Fe transport
MQIYGKNILDTFYATDGYGSVELAGFFTKYYAPGSEYGLTITKNF